MSDRRRDALPTDLTRTDSLAFALPAATCKCERAGLVVEGRCLRCGKPIAATNNNGREAGREQDR